MIGTSVQKYIYVTNNNRLKWSHRLFGLSSRIALTTFVVSVNISSPAQAAEINPNDILTAIMGLILGPLGKSLAILGIVAIGVSWMFGRASLGLVAGVVGGIVIMFGASFIGNLLIPTA